jgi:EAL domain-containing protein (putative c-di-GMP-specific phosphodiesterase class I)
MSWFIEGAVTEGGPILRVPIGEKPLRVGRQQGLDLVLRHDSVSRRHAELYVADSQLWVRDCGSSNGTYVNRQRIAEPTSLHDGDTIHFASCEFLVRSGDASSASATALETMRLPGGLPESYAVGAAQLVEMIRHEQVRCIYEPIVHAANGALWAYEALGRGALDGFFESPIELFTMAGPLALQGELSRLFRKVAVRTSPAPLPPGGLFLNIHPCEIDDVALLIASLRAARREAKGAPLVVELPELLVTDTQALRLLREKLKELEIGLAYDDFGAGQARLVELARIPPDYLKFDKNLVSGLGEDDGRVREMVRLLVEYAHDAGVRCIAEGIETPAAARAALEVGFDFLQGYLFLSDSGINTVTPLQGF